MRSETELDHIFEMQPDQKEKPVLIKVFLISLFGTIGLVTLLIIYGEAIDSFLKTKTGFWTLVGVVTIPGITWAIMKVRAMIQEK